MFTNRRFDTTSVFSGEWAKDGPRLLRFLREYFDSLESKGALDIQEARIRATNGIEFPTNTILDYKKGVSWTPALTFATAGDLSVAYSTQAGTYDQFGDLVIAHFNVLTSTFTHTTASGALRMTGLPVAVATSSGYFAMGGCFWRGITKANFTDVDVYAESGLSYLKFAISGSGQTPADVSASDMPTGGTVRLVGSIIYRA